jgi:transposase
VEPATSLRVTGQPPFAATQHVLEQLRCNACGAYFTAELPEEVLKDGPRAQQYGYSARALMAIYKNLTGMPYFRQQSLQQVMGVSISASTLYDQCKAVADLIAPVLDTLIRLAADAPAFALDDTGNRVLDQTGKQIPDRRTNKPKHRTGVYTSAVVATLDTGQSVYLFKTNIGHAGEWLDEILQSRQATAPPLLMSDALNRNQPSVIDSFVWSKCNAHARREFYDCLSHVGESESVIEQYQTIWRNETHCEEQNLDANARQRYHHEHSLPVMEQLREQCEAWLAPGSKIEENSTFGRACQYFLNHYEGLSRFCYVVGAKLDNNRVEQVLKLIILGRKNSLFYKTQNGADVGDILTSVLGTAVANGINVFDYLVALQQNWFAVGRNANQWLPWSYQETLQSMAGESELATV